MLDVNALGLAIKTAIDSTMPSAFANAFKTTFPVQSEIGETVAEEFGKNITDSFSSGLAKQLAEAIDAYIRNADIYGTIVTTGTAVTQTAIVNSPQVATNGKVPNSLGIM